jgi:hypothetical protein
MAMFNPHGCVLLLPDREKAVGVGSAMAERQNTLMAEHVRGRLLLLT